MITILGIVVVALFSNESAVFIDKLEENMNNGYKWEYVGKQDVVNPKYAIPLGDKVYFQHIKR